MKIGDLTPPKTRPRRKKAEHEKLHLSKEQRKVFSDMGRRGGVARAANLSRAELSEIGRAAANKRWKKKSKKSRTSK